VNTDDFISVLAQDSTVRWPFGRTLAVATASGVAITGLAFFLGVGFRPDIAQALDTGRFLFKFLVTLALATMATGLIWRIARPGIPVGRWNWTLLAAPILLGGAVIVELLVMPESTWMSSLVGTNARHCLTLIPLLAIAPLICLLIALRQGAPARPGIAGAIAGLAASGIAASFYAASCTDDSPLFVATWYPIATVIVVLAGYLAGSRFLKW
jgi:hypothetical protein